MKPETEVLDLLNDWVTATLKRDTGAFAELFVRSDPHPVATWSTGETSVGWSAIRDHIARDFQRGDLGIARVETFDVTPILVSSDATVLAFRYEMTLRDVWGTDNVLQRNATLTLKRMPFGVWKIVTAHFSGLATH